MVTNKRVASRQHRWLSSVEITGVVLSEPVLADAGNFRSLDKAEVAAFRKQREIWNLPKGMVEGNGQPAWINFILEDFLGLKDKEYWQVGASIPADKVVNLQELQETLRPSRILLDEGKAVLLVVEVPRDQSLDKPWLKDKSRWKASPTTKTQRLLCETGVELGLLTNGEAWRLVVASPSETTSWMTWTAQTWNDDPLTLAAFKDLLGKSRFFAGPRDQGILELVKQSRQRQLDVADQLGNQVRESLQILVHELDRADAEISGQYLAGYNEAEVFESSIAFIMRLLFTLYAEENGLLPHGNVTYDRAYGVLHLLTELEETRRLAPEKLTHSYAAYARLLASARLLHEGSIDPDMRIAAHGGQLFNPNRYPLLEGRAKNGEWKTGAHDPPKVRDSVIRDILRSLKYARADGVRQVVSYRTLAVEQIGHMYEGLLDRRVARAPANQTLLLLQGGPKITEPEPVSASEFAGLSEAALIRAIASHTSKTAGTIKKTLERDEDRHLQVYIGTDDAELLAQAKPVERFLQPLGVVRPGGLYVTYGQDRRSSGAHYTPPTLTEPVVRRTLEHQVYVNVVGKPGLLAEPKLIKSPQEILALKVCDPAMGSGAFLVQATRYLAERLADAWERMNAEQPSLILTIPFGIPSQGKTGERLMPESREERIVFARRYVAERCIYGVDMNRLAVEMAKLSIWLTTLSNDRPFTFIDHALKHGNSLVGLSAEQIRSFTWKSMNYDFGPLFSDNVAEDVKQAENHRIAIYCIPDEDFVDKEIKNRIAENTLANLRLKAELAIAAFFDGKNARERESNLVQYGHFLEQAKNNKAKEAYVNKIIGNLVSGSQKITPFCWELEFPEVFQRENAGFDAIIGNPPFLGGTKISTHNSRAYLDWLMTQNKDCGNRTDLSAYFGLLSLNLSHKHSSIGLIFTNTISQGDTREAFLVKALKDGATIYQAKASMQWPGKASVVISPVVISREKYYGAIILDELKVEYISAFLKNAPLEENPQQIQENDGISFEGLKPAGMGFFFEDGKSECTPLTRMLEIISEDPASGDFIHPWISGVEITEGIQENFKRYAIYFGNKSLEEIKKRPALYEIIEERVKPIRDISSTTSFKEKWWQYGRPRPALQTAIKALPHVFVVSRVYTHWIVSMYDTKKLFSEGTVVFAKSDYSFFALIQSGIHEIWARTFGSTLGKGRRYTPTDCFMTFPLPILSPEENNKLSILGKNYIETRDEIKKSKKITYSELYKKMHDQKDQSQEAREFRLATSSLNDAILKIYGIISGSMHMNFLIDSDKETTRYGYSAEDETKIIATLRTLNKNLCKSGN